MLTVLSIGYPLAPISPDAVGGAEQIASALDAALVAAGHRSIVIACTGSQVRGELVELPAPGDVLTHESWMTAHEAARAAIRGVLERAQVDVVHMHGIDFHAYLPPPGVPVLATLHLPVDWYPRHIFDRGRPNTYLSCVSHAQRATAPANADLEVIENGVDLDKLRPGDATGDYALVLGRICPEKAPHLALDAASTAGVPVRLAGKVFGYAEHMTYFREQVLPRLRVPHTFVGAVAGEAKRQLIANARCVVIASQVAETSSLVAMEAFACGTPVVAFRRGALVDLVEDGRTGFLVDDVTTLGHAIGNAGQLDRAACRAAAESRCCQRRMCERYFARYRELAAAPSPRRGSRARWHVEVVDRSGLAELEHDWGKLWDRATSATAFQRPEWCLPWCEHMLAGEPQCVTVWRGSTLEALAPLFRWRDGDVDVLSLMGAGVSDYQDVLVATDASRDVACSLEQTIAELAWGRLELSELRERSVLLRLSLPGREQLVAQDVCPALPLGKGLDAVAPALRREIEYQRRRVTREVGLEQVCLSADAASEALTALHRARWAQRGQAGVVGDATSKFLRAAARRLAIGRVLMATGVRIGRELAAIALGIVDRESLRYYLGGFSPAHERRSPGLLAIAAAIEEASLRGLQWFDFLRGSEHYKYRFGAQDRTRLFRRVVQRT